MTLGMLLEIHVITHLNSLEPSLEYSLESPATNTIVKITMPLLLWRTCMVREERGRKRGRGSEIDNNLHDLALAGLPAYTMETAEEAAC